MMYRRFFIKLLGLTLLSLLQFSLYFGVYVPYKLKNSGDAYIRRWQRFYEQETHADIILIGSSRTLRGINPEIIQRKMKQKVENIAYQGLSLRTFSHFIQDYFIKNKKVKTLILGIDANSLNFIGRISDPYILLPSLPKHSALWDIPQLQYGKLYKPFAFFQFKQSIYRTWYRPSSDEEFNGFFPVDENAYNEVFKDFKTLKTNINIENTTNDFEKISALVKSHKIQTVVVVILPYFEGFWKAIENRNQAVNLLKELSINHKFKYIDLLQCEVSEHQEYFYDPIHLNKNGADRFSEILSDTLKNLIQ